MRMSVLSILAAAAWFAGCFLDRDGSGASGGMAATGGSGGCADASLGGGGGAAAWGTGGAPKLDASSGGTSTTGGTGGTDKLDAGRDAPADVAHDATFVEDCTNGVDDNGDGLADCADRSCHAVVMCVPKVPTGWTASYVHERTSEQPAPDCGPLPVGPTVYRDLSAAPQQCTCGCASPAGGSCTAHSC